MSIKSRHLHLQFVGQAIFTITVLGKPQGSVLPIQAGSVCIFIFTRDAAAGGRTAGLEGGIQRAPLGKSLPRGHHRCETCASCPLSHQPAGAVMVVILVIRRPVHRDNSMPVVHLHTQDTRQAISTQPDAFPAAAFSQL